MKTFPKGRAWIRFGLILLSPVMALALASCWMMSLPGRSFSGPLPARSAEEIDLGKRLEGRVRALAETIGERNLDRYETLQESADYVENAFRKLGLETARQEFALRGKTAANVEATLTGSDSEADSLILGAHYDSVSGCPGANDNASGTAALIEIAGLLRDGKPRRTIRFVAFVNEEPPYFQTSEMGSVVYAKRCRERGEKILGMISLETVGYYSDEPESQKYPFPFGLFYPSTGNFITFVANTSSRSFLRSFTERFRRSTSFPSEGIAAPAWIPGIGWSDQWAFWQEGYPGIMVTDTAPFRYPHYHRSSDTPEKLDYERMGRVVAGVARVVEELANEPD